MTGMDQRVVRYARWVVHYPWLAILMTLAMVIVAAGGAKHLAFTTDYRAFFSPDNPQLRAFEALENTYTKNDNVFFLIAPKDGDAFTRETLATVKTLTDRSWQIPYSIRVESITNFQHSYATGDELVVRDLVPDAGDLTAGDLREIRSIALSEPLIAKRLVSESGHVTAVNVTIQLPGIDTNQEVPEVTAYARELARDIEAAHPHVKIYLTGMVLLNNAFSEASLADMQSVVPISFAVILLSVGFLLRGMSATFVALWVVALSIAAAMGVAGYAGIKITPPSAAAPTIILTLAIANTVHIASSFFHALRHGMDRHAAMIESLRINFQPVLLTSLTTAIGFLSMNFSEAPPFRDLGNIVAAGVAAAWVLSITLLPATMMVLPLRSRAPMPVDGDVMASVAEFVIRRRRALMFAVGGIIVVLLAFIPRNELNDEWVRYFDHRIPFRVDTDFIDQNLGGLYNVQYSLDSGRSSGVSDPDFLRKVDAFAEWYRTQPEVVHVATFTDIMKRLNRNMHGDDPAWYRLPDSQELAAQYLLLFEMSLPYGLDLNNQLNVTKSATRVSVTLKTLSVKDFLALEARAQDWLARNAPNLQSDGAGTTVMFAHIGQRNIYAMLIGATAALVLISIILILAFRSVRMGLTSLMPNLVPAAMGFGLWGIVSGEVGLSLSVVAGMTLGIVVDDTVHFLSKYLRARREKGFNAEDAIRYAFRSVGTALWVTSVVLMAGFLVLAFSAFKINSAMGLLTAIVIGFALLADFLFLPPLLLKLEKKRHETTHSVAAAAAVTDPARS